jgi:hypothetical protein
MKILVNQEEWWPVYEIVDKWGLELDIPELYYNRAKKVFAEFEEIQEYLKTQYHLAEKERIN